MKKTILSLVIFLTFAAIGVSGGFGTKPNKQSWVEAQNIQALSTAGPVIPIPCPDGKDKCRIEAKDGDKNNILIYIDGYEKNY